MYTQLSKSQFFTGGRMGNHKNVDGWCGYICGGTENVINVHGSCRRTTREKKISHEISEGK